MFEFFKNIYERKTYTQSEARAVKKDSLSLGRSFGNEKREEPDFYDKNIAEIISQNKKKATQLKKNGELEEAIDLLQKSISLAAPFELSYGPDLIRKTANYIKISKNYIGCLKFLDKYAREEFAQTEQFCLISLASFIVPSLVGCGKSAGICGKRIKELSGKLQILDLSNQGRFLAIKVRLKDVLEDKNIETFFHKYESSLKSLSDLDLIIHPDRLSRYPEQNKFILDMLCLLKEEYEIILGQMISEIVSGRGSDNTR